MKVGFCTINYSELPLNEVVELVAKKGYEEAPEISCIY